MTAYKRRKGRSAQAQLGDEARAQLTRLCMRRGVDGLLFLSRADITQVSPSSSPLLVRFRPHSWMQVGEKDVLYISLHLYASHAPKE